MSYDPKRKRKQKRKKKRSYDPARNKGMAYGYGAVRGKPYRVGRRSGVAWSAGRKLRYDVAPRRRFAKARHYGGKAEEMINKHSGKLGFFGALLYGVLAGLSSIGKHVPQDQVAPRYFEVLTKEGMHLANFNMQDDWNVVNYLKYKFLGIHPQGLEGGSAWVFPFWASLIAFILTKFKVLPKRINQPLEGISKGALVASTIGALVLPGTRPANSTTATSTTFATTTASEMRYWS